MQLAVPKNDGKSNDIGIKAGQKARVAEALGTMLASTYSLYVKSLFYHWNVTGSNFHSLHEMFEEHYENLHSAGDELAERIRALGHYTPGTMKAFRELSVVDDDSKLPTRSADMLTNLTSDHERCSLEARRVLRIAEEAGDEVTVDMMVERMRFHDQAVWMLSASQAS